MWQLCLPSIAWTEAFEGMGGEMEPPKTAGPVPPLSIHAILTDYSWLLFILVSLILLFVILRDSWLVNIVLDSLVTNRRKKLERYRSLYQHLENLEYHVSVAKQDGNRQLAKFGCTPHLVC